MANNNQIPPFYVGQEVVALTDHPTGSFKKGDEFLVTGIYHGCCGFNITIGKTRTASCQYCIFCFKDVPLLFESQFSSTRFAPKQQEEFKAITFSKIMEEELASQN